MSGMESDYWLSQRQADDYGFTLKDGEKPTLVIGWFIRAIKKNPEPILKDDEKQTGGLAARYFRVYNLTQFDGVPEKMLNMGKVDVPTYSNDTINIADDLVSRQKAIIKHGAESAFYSPLSDEISMPYMSRFFSSEEYYSTMFHEIGHWTGHSSRLNRHELVKGSMFNNKIYSQEELCAEMASVFVCSTLGISNESSVRNSAAYIGAWLKFLKGNPKAFVIGCQQGSKASDYILRGEK